MLYIWLELFKINTKKKEKKALWFICHVDVFTSIEANNKLFAHPNNTEHEKWEHRSPLESQTMCNMWISTKKKSPVQIESVKRIHNILWRHIMNIYNVLDIHTGMGNRKSVETFHRRGQVNVKIDWNYK